MDTDQKHSENELRSYQHSAIAHITEHTHCALFLGMGMGKTVSTLTAVRRFMFEELEINKVLVIAPKRVAESVWSAEIDHWEHLSGLKIVKITGTARERMSALRSDGDIYVLGRDNTHWLCSQYLSSPPPFDMLVIDELSSFKNSNSLRFRALRKIQPHFKRVVGLTGTPTPKGLIDLWAQLYLLDRGESLGKTKGEYLREYFEPLRTVGHIVYKYGLRKGAEQKIYAKISHLCLSMRAEDYLTLPEVLYNYIPVALEPSEIRAYKELEREKILEFKKEGKEVTAVNAAALRVKLCQIANGAVFTGENEWQEVHSAKIEALKEIIQTTEDNVLVAYAYRHDKERIIESLKEYEPKTLDVKGEVIKEWNKGGVKVLVMHPASGGHGLNLQHGGNTIVWFGLNNDLELYQQLNGRLNRQGQQRTGVVHHLVACGTVDEKIVKVLAGKEAIQERVMEAMKKIIENY